MQPTLLIVKPRHDISEQHGNCGNEIANISPHTLKKTQCLAALTHNPDSHRQFPRRGSQLLPEDHVSNKR